ncbi:terminase large subunit [Arsenicitalea aurantiaca]|uniref:Terminase large subunit n=2 Tax=Arsenicitalea aurantiaca TaxID=1783274 RepID=A0A433XGG8_9HYPH|nr:terminase large subunit [Arsenicitalea aurantiaca]
MAAAAKAGEHARDYVGIAERWARDVVAGKEVACKWVKLACRRHLNDLKRAARDQAWGYYFDRWHGDDPCDFIEKLPHVEGVWKTETLFLEPPQIFILVVVFGWRRREDGGRRFSYAYIEMARKGAKSTLTAGVGLYCLTCEGEVGPQVIIGATTGEQAGKVFKPMQKMVRASADLREAFGLAPWVRSITCETSGGYVQPINAKGSTQDGHNPHLGVLDELHAHRDRALFDVIKSAFGSRSNPLMWIITTAGFNTNGVCYEQRTYLTKVLDEVFEADHFFGIIFTLDDAVLDENGKEIVPADDPYDERVWRKANPMLGVTPTLKFMRDEAKDAKASPSSEGNFLTKNLNRWLNANSAWLNITRWNQCADPTLDWDAFEGLDCWIGGDLADKDDITALVLAAFDAQDRLIWKPMFWLPEAVLQDPTHAEGKGPAPYRTWEKQGHLQLTPGDWVDHNAIEEQIEEWIGRFTIRHITFDQFAAAQAMASRLNEKHGSGDEPLATILHKKASNVTDPAKELETRVKGGPARLRHDGNPVMTWMASNVVVSRRRDETILPIKESQMSPNKIDGIDALINAIAPAVANAVAEDDGMDEFFKRLRGAA